MTRKPDRFHDMSYNIYFIQDRVFPVASEN